MECNVLVKGREEEKSCGASRGKKAEELWLPKAAGLRQRGIK
jgi:hypothetical protein